jgi:hypothetical protein
MLSSICGTSLKTVDFMGQYKMLKKVYSQKEVSYGVTTTGLVVMR